MTALTYDETIARVLGHLDKTWWAWRLVRDPKFGGRKVVRAGQGELETCPLVSAAGRTGLNNMIADAVGFDVTAAIRIAAAADRGFR